MGRIRKRNSTYFHQKKKFLQRFIGKNSDQREKSTVNVHPNVVFSVGNVMFVKSSSISETSASTSHPPIIVNSMEFEDDYSNYLSETSTPIVEGNSVDNIISEVVDIDEDETLLEDEVDKNVSLMHDLRDWATRNRICRGPLNELLAFMRSKLHVTLPKDARSLLQTPRSVEIQQMGTGEFWYHGIRRCIKNSFSEADTSLKIKVNFFVDGLPIFESSTDEFWPILMNYVDMPHIRPAIVAMYHGKGKPPSTELFLREFQREFNDILLNGVELESGLNISVELNAFIADTPARHFIKCVKGHTGYSSCTKCNVIGEYDCEGRHVSFSRTNCPLRTHDEFIQKRDEDHHLYDIKTQQFLRSPLEDITGIDMIKNFPVAETMHLFELGKFIPPLKVEV